tara:strand:- start:1586 stop:4192 length:2607 start_codon:yes stop_codon:yes gene_type:complete
MPFNFGGTDTHVLEMGHNYLRVMRDDYHITEAEVGITGVTHSNPCVITAVAHGLTSGDEVFVSDVGGTIQLSNRRFNITAIDVDTFSIQSQYDGTDIDSTGYTQYTSGGYIAKIYEIETPYSSDDIFDLKFSQSFDIFFIRHPDYPTYNLKRFGLDDWRLEESIPNPTVSSPTNVSTSVTTTGSQEYRYAVTAVSNADGEESLTGLDGTALTVTNITQASPAVMTLSTSTEALRTGHEIEITGVSGMTELNGRRISLIRLSGTQFELREVDSTEFGAYASGGSCTPGFSYISNGAEDADNTISWNAVSTALKYIIYREVDGIFAFLAETQDLEYLDDNDVEPDTTDNPPQYRNPFFGSGNYPAAIGSFQQRSGEGGTANAKASIEFSGTGAFSNFNRSLNSKDDDAFRITISANSQSPIRHIAEVKDLVVLTESTVKRLFTNGQPLTRETLSIEGPDDIGASELKPIVVNQEVIFENSLKTGIYAAKFTLTVDGISVEELSAFSSHLFKDHGMVDWVRVKGENQFIAGTRADGQIICFTYNPDEKFQVNAWTRWVTQGQYKSTTAVRSNLNGRSDSIYYVVERNINGNVVKYIETSKDQHDPELIEDCFFCDSGLKFSAEWAVEAVSDDAEAVFSVTGHDLSENDTVRMRGFVWRGTYDKIFNLSVPRDFNGFVCKVKEVTTNTFKLERVDTKEMLDGSTAPFYRGGGLVGKQVSTVYGFDHLVGESLVALLDGDVVSGITVQSDGSIQLPRPAAVASIGIRYVADVKSLSLLDLKARLTQGKFSSLKDLYVNTYLSRGMLFGTDFDNLDPWPQRANERFGEPTTRKTGVTQLSPQPKFNREAALCIRQADPLPLTVRSFSLDNYQPS